MIHTHVQKILELIDDRICNIKSELKEIKDQHCAGFNMLIGALDELHYIKNDIEEMFGES